MKQSRVSNRRRCRENSSNCGIGNSAVLNKSNLGILVLGLPLLALVIAEGGTSSVAVAAWQTSPSNSRAGATFRYNRPRSNSRSGAGGPTMYMPPNTPTSEPPHFTAQKMLRNSGAVTTAISGGDPRQQRTVGGAAARSSAATAGFSGGTASQSQASSQRRRRQESMKLSNSVLASCDTLPSFPTAHGLLSPETVMRLDENCEHKSDALRNFLDTYRRKGPLSCLPMLSDPDVLPHLTKAMRDIAA